MLRECQTHGQYLTEDEVRIVKTVAEVRSVFSVYGGYEWNNARCTGFVY